MMLGSVGCCCGIVGVVVSLMSASSLRNSDMKAKRLRSAAMWRGLSFDELARVLMASYFA